jgi:multicomponent Na+:H+ antiporter subunit A
LADPAPSGPPPHAIWRYLPPLISLAAFIWFLGFLGPVARGDIPELVLDWVPGLNIQLAFWLDGLALGFALLITGIGAICLLYAGAYFAKDPRLPSLQIVLLLFAFSMLGLVVADDAITLFVFWEGTTITSFLLVGFDHEKAKSRDSALQALIVTGMGGLGLLVALLMMGDIAGTYRLSEMNAMGDVFRDHTLYTAIFWLVVFGAFTKSAQWPFQFWLPGAMAAPTPVSAYLHSATMVKAGIYLLARFTPALGGTDVWIWVLTVVGAVTMVQASIWALRQTDLKLMMAYTTVMALGALTMLLGQGTPMAVTAAMAFILVHAFYKAALFLSVGMIDKGAGTREYLELGGLRGAMPLTFTVIAIAALSMAGFPPMFGFIGKELVYKSVEYANMPWFVGVMALAANALMVVCAGVVALRPFLGARQIAPKAAPADPGWGLWLGPVILAGLGVLGAVLAGQFEYFLVAPMVLSVTGGPMAIHLALYHGINMALLLSLVTFAVGIALYFAVDRIRTALIAADPKTPATESGYDWGLQAMKDFAAWQTRIVQSGHMTRYLQITFALMAALVWGALYFGDPAWPAFAIGISLFEWAILGIIVASVGLIVLTESRLTAIAGLGGVGAGIAVIFFLYGGIDVGMTQLFVEILVVVFIAIAMVRLPRSGSIDFRPANAVIAVVLGIGVTIAVLTVLGTPMDLRLSDFFEAASAPEARGRNIVNVILVDFRALDTFGEVAVVVIAGISAIAALWAGKRITTR